MFVEHPTTPLARLILVEKIVKDKGLKGAEYSIRENNRVSQFVGYKFNLVTVIAGEGEDITKVVEPQLTEKNNLIIADLKTEDLLNLTQLAKAQDKLIFNIRDSNDDLRGIKCQANLFHIIPSWNMRADALAQYLIWKKWFVVHGKSSIDQEYVAAIKRAAQLYRAKIVEQRAYKFEAGSQRIESGHQQIQTQMPRLTQNAKPHDVVFVADAAEAFGEYLMYRTESPRPVVGSHGLVATAWHRSFEQFGGMSIQRSFEKFAKRIMSERDYNAWLAIKLLAKTIIRIKSQDTKK